MVKTVEKLVTGQKIKPQRVPFWLRIMITLVFMVVVFLFAVAITYLATRTKYEPPSTYAECLDAKGSIHQKTYPAVCISKEGSKFVQPLSAEEQKLLEAPITGNPEGQFCGGIMGKLCPEGYNCKYDGDFPDAGGKCSKN